MLSASWRWVKFVQNFVEFSAEFPSSLRRVWRATGILLGISCLVLRRRVDRLDSQRGRASCA